MRVLLVALGFLALAAAPAEAATRTYSSRTIARSLADAATTEVGLRVADAGPVSKVRVFVRLDHPATSELTVSLVSPSGVSVPLIARRGTGSNLGSGAGCGGRLTGFEDDGTELAEGSSPFLDEPWAPERPFARFQGEEARGTWRLRIEDAEPGGRGTLRCWKLELSRAVVETKRASRGRVTAELSFVERSFQYEQLRLRIRRAGATLVDAPLARLNCDGCPNRGFLLAGERPLTVSDLDADGEPEVLLDLYTGGAHCCSYSLIFRHRREGSTYGRIAAYWGNVGYRLVDHDRDGRPELASFDDRFAYAFVAYAFTAEPVRLWHYEHGRLLDVTRAFPAVARRAADDLWRDYLLARRDPEPEVRGILAAYLADSYLIGREELALRRIGAALARGELGTGRSKGGFPAGRAYLGKLRLFMRRTGYAR